MLCCAVVSVWRTRDHDYREIFSIRAAYGVDGRKPTDAESHHRGRRAACASITLGRVTAVQFIATIDLLQVLVFQKLIEQNQVEVTCDRKMMLQAYLRQTSGQIGSDSIHSVNSPDACSYCKCARFVGHVNGYFGNAKF